MRARVTIVSLATIGVSFLLAAAAHADIIHLESGGKYRGTIIKETSSRVTIKTKVGTVRVPRDEISRIVREDSAKATFKKRYKSLKAKQDAEGLYALGKWATQKGLKKSARKAFKRAIKLDAFHREAREALGHKLHKGRWYSPAEYKRVVQGLVKYKDRWVSPEDKERLEAGLVKNRDGVWVLPQRPEDPRAPRAASKRQRPKPRSVRASSKRADKPARPLPKVDKSWYRDNTRSGDFGSAPITESRYYKIKTNAKPEYAKRYGKMMDRYYVRFLKVFREFLPKGEIKKSSIWIYSSKQEFMSANRLGPNVGGFYSTGTKRVTAFHGLFGQTGTTRTVLAHEGTHQFEDIVLGGRFRNCPIWILEGLAVFFESAYYDGKDVVIGLVPRDRLAALKRGLANNSLIPLTTLIRTPQPRFTGYHYAHAWGLIYMILYYGENRAVRKKTQKWFSDLFSASKKGPVTPEMVEERCGGRDKFLELERRWKDWIRGLSYDFKPKR